MKLQRLMSLTRKAVDEFNMISDGDKIAVGISGGKDSLALLYALANMRVFYPKKYELIAITIDLGFEGFDLSRIRALCEELDVPYHVVKTEIKDIVFDTRQESNPCSLCAKMRKGAFNDEAKRLGCNKAAYAHHKDDVIDTMLMSLIYEGRFYTFSPVTYLDRMDITLIRPLLYVNEADIVGFEHLYNVPVTKNPCPADGVTKREYVRDLIKQINADSPGLRERLFHAITDSTLPNWQKKTDI